MSNYSNNQISSLIEKMDLVLRDNKEKEETEAIQEYKRLELSSEEKAMIKSIAKILVAISRLGKFGVWLLLGIVIVYQNLEYVAKTIGKFVKFFTVGDG